MASQVQSAALAPTDHDTGLSLLIVSSWISGDILSPVPPCPSSHQKKMVFSFFFACPFFSFAIGYLSMSLTLPSNVWSSSPSFPNGWREQGHTETTKSDRSVGVKEGSFWWIQNCHGCLSGEERIAKMVEESCQLYGVMLQWEEGELAGTVWEWTLPELWSIEGLFELVDN